MWTILLCARKPEFMPQVVDVLKASLTTPRAILACTRKSSLRSPFYWLHDEVLFYVAVSVKKISSLV